MIMTPDTAFMRFVYGALTAMGMFITAYEKHDRIRDKFQMDKKESQDAIETFDFVIVGGGTAGSIVATRLAEKWRVLLLEAGGEPFPLQSIPSLAPYLIMGHKEIDWKYKTTPQKHACQALKQHRTNICQGKGLGGTSNMGFQNYLRGSPFDYESWANVTGSPHWRYSNLLPYFKRMESYRGIWTDPDVHGFDGEMSLQSPNYTGMGKRFIRSGMDMNYKMVDLNGIFTEGFDYILSPLRRGYRQTTTTAYLNSIRPSPRLTIRKYATVQKVLFRKDNETHSEPAAYGVVYERHGKLVMAVASKEVILSAGAIGTPKLLMMSGIGTKNVLNQLKIPLVKELPVGKNLQDHLITYLGPFMLNSSGSGESFLMDRDLTAESVAQFGLIEGQGPLTSTGLHGNALLVSSRQKMRGNVFWPDLQLTLYGMAHHSSIDKEFQEMFNLKEEIVQEYFNATKGRDSFSIIISGARPFSRGRVRLFSTNSSVMPLINPKYLSDPRDLSVMVDGIYRALSLVENSQAFQEVGASLSQEKFPSCKSLEFRSKDYWECYIRSFSMSANHFVGTCTMGKSEGGKGGAGRERDSVVDGLLKVIGVGNLRVIDASVIPTISVGGTLAPTMVVAEKGADMIRDFWEMMEALKI